MLDSRQKGWSNEKTRCNNWHRCYFTEWNRKKDFWGAIVNGKSAVERITAFDVAQFNSQVASEVKGFNPRAFGLREDQIRRMDRYVQFAVAGARMAVEDSGIDLSIEDRERIGVCIANAICGTKYMEEEFIVVTQWGKELINPEYVSPYLYDASVFNTPSNEIAAEYNLMGGCYALSTGCTAGTDSIIHAYKSIARGETDVMIAGASEAPITPIALAAFDVINALAKGTMTLLAHQGHLTGRETDLCSVKDAVC